MSTIPIIVICYNNYKYVQLMIHQLENLLVSPDIRIFNNHSTEQNTLNYLLTLSYPVINGTSEPPTGDSWVQYMYDLMPNVFAVTGPSVLFNSDMPNTFLEYFIEISNRFQSKKVGPALRINDQGAMYQYRFKDYGYEGVETIYEGQLQFWTNQICVSGCELYLSPIDNTFAVYNKNYFGPDIRVAGDYTCRILTWYQNISDVLSPLTLKISRYHRYIAITDPDTYQPIKYFELQYLSDQNIHVVSKRNYDFLIQFDTADNSSPDDLFWINDYPTNWKEDFFNILDTYLDSTKQYLDIGSWIGDTAIYASRRSAMVVAVEPDQRILSKLKQTFENNYLETNIYLFEEAIYETTGEIVYYTLGENGRIYRNDVGNTSVVNTISFEAIISKYNLNNLSLINLNINGSEEYVLQQIYDFSMLNRIPLYVTFYHFTWENSDITRFAFLTEQQQIDIVSGVVSILFNP